MALWRKKRKQERNQKHLLKAQRTKPCYELAKYIEILNSNMGAGEGRQKRLCEWKMNKKGLKKPN